MCSSLIRAVQAETLGGAVATGRKREKRNKGGRNVDLFKKQKVTFGCLCEG